MTPCIISVAITGSLPKKADSPAVPVTVAEQVESTHEAFQAAATLVHLHVRNDDGSPSSAPERFSHVLEGIRRHCPGIITQVSTGGRSGAGKERGGMLHLKPDMASLATGSVNFPTRVYATLRQPSRQISFPSNCYSDAAANRSSCRASATVAGRRPLFRTKIALGRGRMETLSTSGRRAVRMLLAGFCEAGQGRA